MKLAIASTLQRFNGFSSRTIGACLLLALAPLTTRADSVVAFNEIMYHPSTNEAVLEWVELRNLMAVDVDLSRWTLKNGISYTFPEGTVIQGGGYLVVAVSPADLMAATGLTNVLGPFTGRLSNAGEKIELHNSNDREMDAVNYGVEGDWPVAPDGTGVSLAKVDEDLAGDTAGNWRSSAQLGGTPGSVNFPRYSTYISSTNSVVLASAWKYESSGTDQGTSWKDASFDDGGWSSGAGLLYAGTTWRPGEMAPIATLFSSGIGADGSPVVPGLTDPHYVLTSSAYSTPPPPNIAATVMQNHSAWLANDASSVWIGPISQGTVSVPGGMYNYLTTFDLSSYDLATAQIVYQVAVDNIITNIFLNGVALGRTYSAFATFSSPFTNSSGFVPGVNTLEFRTTNTAAGPTGFRVLASGTARKVAPTNTVLAAGPMTHYFRRSFVLNGDPNQTGLRFRCIADDGAVVYLNGAEVLRLNMPAGAVDYLTAASTNVPNASYSPFFDLPHASLVTGTNVLAVEIHQATPETNDIMFGAELTLAVTNLPPAPPPVIVFNEMSSVTNAQFWVEIMNAGTNDVFLDGAILTRYGNTNNRDYTIPSQTLPVGGFLVLDRTTIGFGADPGDRVMLYYPGKTNVYDGMIAKSYPQARYPDGTGDWRLPSPATPGASNSFAFNSDIVINEIMYHQRDLPSVDEVRFTNTLVTLTNLWRYDQSGSDLGSSWRETNYNDSGWAIGRGLLTAGTFSSLPAPKGAFLNVSNAGQPIITYYARTTFNYTNLIAGLQLTLRHIINDAAIIYLNGVEVYRYNLPVGPVSSSTFATYRIGVPANLGPFYLPTSALVQGTNVLAVEFHQFAYPLSRDIVFGCELVANGVVSPYLPWRDSQEAWVELYNRGSNIVDLTGWSLDKAVNFNFPTGKTIAPGAYLLVAEDAAYLQSLYPALDIAGTYSGKLNQKGDHIILRDPLGNPANSVRYYDGNPWPSLPDGYGHSLELRDPRADNSKPETWAASDETSRSSWQTYTYRGTAAVETASSPTQWKEFILGLLGEGEVWLDDISVLESPGGVRRQLIPNGSFEASPTPWRLIGTHRRSSVITEPGNPANHVLRVVATGDTEHMHNQCSITLTNGLAITNGLEYEISFRAKWIAGCHKLNTRLYFNRLARTTELTVPALGGTPGAPNSQLVANLGPTFENLAHAPVVPTNNQPVVVSVEAGDTDTVTNLNLWYAVNGGTWQSLPMSSYQLRNTHFASATIPGQAASAIVQFFVEGIDGLGAASTYPAGGTNSRALYKVSSGVPGLARLHTVRVIMPPADAAALHYSTNVMSNEDVLCTMISDDRHVFYNSTVHLQGSERGRDNNTRVGFTVRTPADKPYRGVQEGFTVDRSGGYSGLGGDHDEILLKNAINRVGNLPGMYDDLCQFYGPRSQEDSTGLMVIAKYGDVFLDSTFQNGGNGEMHKLELIYYPTSTANGDVQGPKLPQPDSVLGTDIKDLGDSKEAYRWTFLKENHAARDNYAPMMALAKAMSLSGSSLDARIRDVMDVDEWLRAVAFIGLVGGGDIYTFGNSHNLLIYFRPEDQRGMAFLWDLDYSFVQATNTALPGSGSANTYKLITTIPDNYRRYINHLWDLSNTTGDTNYMGQWANRYSSLVGQSWQGVVNYLAQRARWVRSQMPLNTPFAIANNNGNNFSTANGVIILTGTAPMSVRDIEINGLVFGVTWTSMTNWMVNLPLPFNTNYITVQGLSNDGTRLTNALDSIVITNTSAPAFMPVVINEWMADNASPGGFADPADGSYQDWFELYNPNNFPVNLSGYFLTDNLGIPNKFTVPTNTYVPALGFRLVWADNQTNQNGMGTNGDLHANFQLSNNGEAIGLYAPDGTPQHIIVFGPQFENVSQGLYADGNTNAIYLMTNFTPRAANYLPPPPGPIAPPGKAVPPQLTLTGKLPDGSLLFEFSTTPGWTYRVEFKSELGGTAWTALTADVVATGASLTFTDTPENAAQRFYRVIVVH